MSAQIHALTGLTKTTNETEGMSAYGKSLSAFRALWGIDVPLRFRDMDDSILALDLMYGDKTKAMDFLFGYDRGIKKAQYYYALGQDSNGLYTWNVGVLVRKGPFVGCLGFGYADKKKLAIVKAQASLKEVMLETYDLIDYYHPERLLPQRLKYGKISEDYFWAQGWQDILKPEGLDARIRGLVPNELYDEKLVAGHFKQWDVYRYARFREPCLKCDKYHNHEYFSLNKLLNDIELNPGPVSLPIEGINLQITEFDKTKMEFPDGTIFVMHNDHFFIKDDKLIIKKPTVDFMAYVNDTNETRPKINFECDIAWKKLSTIWSNHHDYQPFLRCIIVGDEKLNKVNKEDDLFKFYKFSQGSVFRAKNFLFLPVSLLRVRFSKVWYNGTDLELKILNMFMSSIVNQDMNKTQFVQTVVRIVQLKMMLIKNKSTVLDEYADMFWTLYRATLKNLKHKRTSYTDYELNVELGNIEVIVPTTSTSMSPKKLNTKAIMYVQDELTMKDQVVNQHKLAPYDQKPAEEMTLGELREFFVTGRNVIFGTTVTRRGFKADRKYKRLSETQVSITTDAQKFLSKLISSKHRSYNIYDIFEKAVKFMDIDELSPEFQRKILLKMCRIQFASMDYKGLYQLYMKNDKTEEDYVTLALSSQNEMVAFGKLFDIDYDFNIFANREYIKMLKGPSNITLETEAQDEGWMARLKQKLLSPVHKVADTWTKAGESVNNLADYATKTIDGFTTKLNNLGFPSTQESVVYFDTATIKGVYQSAKTLIMAMFEDLLNKVCSLFGVTYERRIAPETLFMYYLIWKETTSEHMRFMILLDIAVQLGIADILWEVMVVTFKKCKNLLVPGNITKNVEKEKYLLEQANNIKMMQENSSGKRKKLYVDLPQVEDDAKDEVGFIDGIIKLLSNMTPTILGAATIAILGVLGYKGVDEREEKIGKKIVNMSRNMGFLALGIGSIPRVYTNFMGIFKYVKEWIMEKMNKKFKSEVTLENEAKHFLKTAVYTPGASEYVMFSDLAVCIKFFQHYSQALEFSKDLYRIKCPRVAAELKNRIKDIISMNTLVMSAVAMQLKSVELIHIQYYSEPGVGKTDLMFHTVEFADKIRVEVENQIRKEVGLPDVKQSKIPSSGIYMANENTNNEDGYHGQKKCIVDDTHVVKNPTPESIIDKLSKISGTPRIVKKADLNSKGMIRNVSTEVSATNVPFPKFDGMYRNEAIWRRRILVGLKVKDQYLQENKLVDNAAIMKDKLDRKRGEHLLFTFLDPVDECIVPEQPWMKDLEASDFWDILDTKVRVHFLREDTRQCQNPTMAELRLHFEAMMENIRTQIGQEAPNNVSETISMMRAHIEKKVDTWIAEDESERELYERTKTLELEELDVLETVSPYMLQENDNLVPLTKNLVSDTDLIDFENGEPSNISDIFSSAYATLQYTRRPEGHIYRMVASDKLSRTRDARIDYHKVFFDISPGNTMEHMGYKSEKPLTPLDQEVVLHHLMRLSVLGTRDKIRAAIELGVTTQDTYTKYEKIKEKFSYTIRRTEEVIRSSGTWVWDRVSDLAKDFYNAIIHGLGIAVAFFAFVAMLKLLAPSNTSYSRQNDRRIVSGPSINSNISRTLEENTQSLARSVSYRMFILGEKTKECMAIGVGGSVFLVNWHAVSEVTRPCTVIIADNLTVESDPAMCLKTLNITPNQIKRVKHDGKDYDAALIHIEGFRPVRTALNYFVTDHDIQEDFINFTEAEFQTLMLRECQNSVRLGTYNVQRAWNMSTWHGAKRVEATGPVVEHTDYFEFVENVYAKHGDSGSLVYHNNTRIPPKFFGILMAASCTKTYFGCITQEAIRETLQRFPNTATMNTIALQGEKIENIHRLYPVFEYPEHVYVSRLPNQSVSTNPGYEKTQIARHFPCTSEPAVQTDSDPRVPSTAQHFLKASLNKSIDYNPNSFTPDEEKFYCEFLRRMYLKHLPNIDKVRVYDTVRAIAGVQRMGSTSIDTKSSAGLPYKLEKGVSGKRPFIQYNTYENCWEIQERVFRDVEMYERHYLAGQVPFNHKLEFRKRELVSPEKIARSKTRTVGTGNMCHLIVYNKLFKDFFTMLKNSWVQGRAIPIITGLNMEEHTDIFMKFFVDHNYVLDFDVKAWEQKVTLKHLILNNRVRTQLIKDMYKLRGEKLPYDIEVVGLGLAVDYMDTSVVFEDVVYSKWSGLLSGHAGTLVENSEAHLGEIALIIRDILIRAGKPELATPNKILENVTCMVAADDVLISITPSWQAWVNLETIREGYKRRGFEITAADKSQNFNVKNIFTAQFLKHNIRIEEDGRYVQAPQAEIIYQLLHWVRTDTELTKKQQFLTNIDNAMRMAFFRGREFYDDIKEKLNFAMLDTKDKEQWPYSYEHMRDKILLKFRDDSDPIANAQHDDTEIDFRF
uniref:Putative polyprotein n=1 Tax=Hammarskog picorna-like virus TaxID=2665417 RepID=A0A8K1MN23_9VIRU|nr:putative polyprotein [Hammarskog picorna-like virus]